MNNEIWKDVIGYEGLYKVSNMGRIKTKPIVAKSKTTEQVFYFGSVTDGARWLLSTGKTKDQTCLTGIIKCCKHTIKSYQGYVWDYE